MMQSTLEQQKDPGKGWERAGHITNVAATLPVVGLSAVELIRGVPIESYADTFKQITSAMVPEIALLFAIPITLGLTTLGFYANARSSRQNLDDETKELLNIRMNNRGLGLLSAAASATMGLEALNFGSHGLHGDSLYSGAISLVNVLYVNNNLQKIDSTNRMLSLNSIMRRRRRNEFDERL